MAEPNPDLIEAARQFLDNGVVVIPVTVDKSPLLGDWRRVTVEEVMKNIDLFSRAAGIGLLGGQVFNIGGVQHRLVIIDVDDPEAFKRALEGADRGLVDALSNTWGWRTGPRCPIDGDKHNVECDSSGRCIHRVGNDKHEFELANAPRGRGYAVLVPVECAPGGTDRSIWPGVVELLVNNYALIPPSLHPSGVRYEWVNPPWGSMGFHMPIALTCDEWRLLYSLLARQGKRQVGQSTGRGAGVLRRLSDSQLVELKNLLKPAYRPGHRQMLALFTSGWFAKAGVDPVSAARLIVWLHDETGDEDPLKERLAAVVYSYRKAGIDVDAYAREIEGLAGVRPYGLDSAVREGEVKGKSGVLEILEEALGSREEALAVVMRIEEILGAASPFRDVVAWVLDHERRLYAVADLRGLRVVRGRLVDGRLIYREVVAIGAPTGVEVYLNPLGGVTKFKVTWEAPTRPRPIVIGPAAVDEVVERLRAENLVVNSRLARDVIGAVLEAFIQRGRAVVKAQVDAPGFYLVDGGVVAVDYIVEEPDMGELREALLLLNELAEYWYGGRVDRFATAVKWGLIAPFGFIYKQRGRWVPWLYMHGVSGAGKTTLGEVLLALWGLLGRRGFDKVPGSNMDTEARLGRALAQSTFPILVIEPGEIFMKEELVEMVKSAVESTVARGRHGRGGWEEFPSLAMLILTSNREAPRDEALWRRLLPLRFTPSDVPPPGKAAEFEARVLPRLPVLRAIGQYAAYRVVNEPSLLDLEWRELAARLLEDAYREAGLQAPGWVRLEARVEEDPRVDVVEALRAFLVKRINEAFSRGVGRVDVIRENGAYRVTVGLTEVDFREKVNIVLRERLLPWAMVLNDDDNDIVVFTTAFAREVEEELGVVGGLSTIAELLGWRYTQRKLGGRVMRVTEVGFEELLQFLAPGPEPQEEPKAMEAHLHNSR